SVGLKLAVTGGQKQGRVASQDPTSGTLVDPGRVVAVELTKGSGPGPVTVPVLIGKNRKEAQAELDKLKLVLKADGDVKAGGANKQNPTAGTTVAPGATVAVTFGKAAATVTVPSVIGQNAGQALKTLGKENLTLSAKGDTVNGVAVKQAPAALAQV